MKEFFLEEILWNDVRDEVHKINPELAKVCDQISPGQEHTLFRIRYPYGSKIVDRGSFQLPSEHKVMVSLKDQSVPEKIKKKIVYSPIPLCLVLHNDTEVFVEANDRVTPLNFFKPGDLFGVFESINLLTGLDAKPIWSVTAGGRSVFMLPRIADKTAHNRIRKEFRINNEKPDDLKGQWEIFKGIYDCAGGIDCWHNDILVFTESWFSSKNDDATWLRFYNYLLKSCWLQMKSLIDFGLLWSGFSQGVSIRNLKPRTYLIDTVKHLVSIANNFRIAFKPAEDETALPVSLIQNAYMDCYMLKNYVPVIMQPSKLGGKDKQVYYSLCFPTVLESSPYTKHPPSIIEDQRSIKKLLETLVKSINDGSTHIVNPIKYVRYEFFHSEIDPYGEIKNSQDISLTDHRFNETNSRFHDRFFCSTAQFFRGCIRVSRTS